MFSFRIIIAQSNQSLSPAAESQKNINIDLFRGKHTINIPILNYSTQNLNVPVSLDYFPYDTQENINKLNEPGITGLGWGLTCGGVITRTIKDKPDETKVTGNFLNYNDSTWDPSYNINLLSNYELGEDEFNFNFCGHSGKFIFYRGKWLVFSDDDFNITYSIKSNEIGENELVGFRLISSTDGAMYFFGGENAVEYSSYVNNLDGTKNTTPHSTGWYLTKIVSPEGDQINFEYQQGSGCWLPTTSQINYNTVSKFTIGNVYQTLGTDVKTYNEKIPTDNEFQNKETGIFIKDVYLYRISSPTNPLVIQFNKSLYNKSVESFSGYNQGFKLDNIELKYNYNSFKRFDFVYDYTGTLQLKTVKESAISESGTVTSLPSYQFSYISKNDLIAPNVLNKIMYPTGGSSSFAFEKNIYLAYINETAENSVGMHTVWQESGFRIQKQITRASDNDTPVVLKYFYTENIPTYSVNQSSGVLGPKVLQINIFSSIPPVFAGSSSVATGNYYAKINGEDLGYLNPQQLKNTTVNQSEVGYSSVWVVRSNVDDVHLSNSIRFENYQFNTDTYLANGSRYWRNLCEIGKLTKYVQCDGNGVETKSIYYRYDKGPVKNYTLYYILPLTYYDYYGNKKIDIKVYKTTIDNFKYNLVEKIENNHGFENYTEYKYDNKTNFLREIKEIEPKINYDMLNNPGPETEINYSILSTTTTTYKYYSDFYDIGQDVLNMYDNSRTQKSKPVEIVTTKDGKVIGAKFIKYTMLNNNACNILKPKEIYNLDISNPISDYIPSGYNWEVKDARYKLKITYDKYDNNCGNLLQYHVEGNVPTSIFYHPTYNFPLIEAKNCTYDILKSTIENNGINDPNNCGEVLRLRSLLPNAMITSKTYNLKFGESSATQPNGASKFIQYDDFGRTKSINNNSGNIIQFFDYNYNIH